MNSGTDILLIIAIVIGLIAAASLPMVSVNAISSDSLRLRADRRESPPWVLTADDAQRRRGPAMQESTVLPAPDRGTVSALPQTSPSSTRMSARDVVEALPAALMDPAPGSALTH